MYSTVSATECAKTIGRTLEATKRMACKLRIKSVKFVRCDRKAIYERLTDLTRPDTCYLLGLIWGDGTLTVSGFALTMATEDLKEVDWILKELGPIASHIVRPKKEHYKEATSYSVACKELLEWMTDRGYKTKSYGTPSRLLNEMPADNRHHFFRGYFDADGHWGLGKQGKGSFCSRWTVTGDYLQDWTEVENLLKSLGLQYRIQKGVVKMGRHSSIRMSDSRSIIRLGEYVYQGGGSQGISLSRKYLMYQAIRARHEESERRRQEKRAEFGERMAFIASHPDLTYDEYAKRLGIPYGKVQSAMVKIHEERKHVG